MHWPERGTPRGEVVSPRLSNVCRHEVLDQWFEHEVQPRLRGRAFEIRFADDSALVFEREDDARRVKAVLAKRFARFGLRSHPDKTWLVDFRSPPRRRRQEASREERSFDLLDFTHFLARSGKGGGSSSARWQPRAARDRAVVQALPPPSSLGTVAGTWPPRSCRCRNLYLGSARMHWVCSKILCIGVKWSPLITNLKRGISIFSFQFVGCPDNGGLVGWLADPLKQQLGPGTLAPSSTASLLPRKDWSSRKRRHNSRGRACAIAACCRPWADYSLALAVIKARARERAWMSLLDAVSKVVDRRFRLDRRRRQRR